VDGCASINVSSTVIQAAVRCSDSDDAGNEEAWNVRLAPGNRSMQHGCNATAQKI
jgi:hypothetical protein